MSDFGIFGTKPDFVNDIGTSFWLDKDLTKYAKDKGLEGIRVFYVKDKVGNKGRVVIQDNEYIYESPRLEDVAIHLDIMAFQKKKEL